MCKLIIWGPKWFQIKKLLTTKFYNFLGSTIFIYGVSPSEVVYKIWILNLRNSNVVFAWQDDSKTKSCQL